MSKLDLSFAIALGFSAGAAVATVFLVCQKETRKKRVPCKRSHPREWAVWARVDREGKGWVTRDHIRSLCYRFESDEHAEVLADVLDPDGEDHITFAEFIRNFKAVSMMRTAARRKLWHRCIGLGVAGNVAGHMAQAGEAEKSPTGKKETKPAAIFTYFIPPHCHEVCDFKAARQRLELFPVTYAVLDFPKLPGSSNIQVEPELALYCDIVYSKCHTRVERLVPRRVAAFNDCSIRSLTGATKLSQKKNWGFGSKGISIRSFPIDSFSPGSFVDHLVIVSWMKRGDVIEQYSKSAPARNYLMFHEPLLEWIVESINTQKDSDKWEEVFPHLVESEYPTSTWIALGAGEYTEYGETHFMQPLDEAVIVVYDERKYPSGICNLIVQALFEDKPNPEGTVVLHQTFV